MTPCHLIRPPNPYRWYIGCILDLRHPDGKRLVRGGPFGGGDPRLCDKGFRDVIGFLRGICHDGAGDAGNDQLFDAELANIGGVVEIDGTVDRSSGKLDVVLGEEVGDGETCYLLLIRDDSRTESIVVRLTRVVECIGVRNVQPHLSKREVTGREVQAKEFVLVV